MVQQQLGRYIIEDLLGEGAFAWVYRAKDADLGRAVALKVLRPAWLSDPQALSRFKHEASTMAKLHHPNIAVIYEVGEAEGQVYLAQFLVEGETLAIKLSREGALAWSQMLDILRQVASALDYAHEQGLVHRDVKPANILLGKKDQVYLSDFGLVRAAEGSTSLSGSLGGAKGTPFYIAPEVWEDQPATAASDVYALTCVVFEMLTGSVLFEGSTQMAVMRKHDKGPEFPAAWPPGIPEEVTGVLQRGLAKNPAQRIGRAGELVAALTTLNAPAPTPALELVRADGQRFGVQPGSLTLGRARDNDIPLDDRAASRVHATLEFDGQSCTLYDEGSANGTFVNGQRVSKGGQPLHPGDEVRIGETVFTLRQTATAAPLPAPTTPIRPAAPLVNPQAATTVIPAATLKAARTELDAKPEETPIETPPPPIFLPPAETASPQPAAEVAPIAPAASKAGPNKGLLVVGVAAAMVALALVGGGIFLALTPTPKPVNAPTSTHTPTLTHTPEPPTDTPTATPTPTPTLPRFEPITTVNTGRVVELSRWGDGVGGKIRFSPDGTSLAVGGFYFRLYSADTLELQRTLDVPGVVIDWSPDGTQLVWLRSNGKTIGVGNVATGEERCTLEGHTDDVLNVAWSSDGTRLASSSWDMTVRLWDTTTCKELHVLKDKIMGSLGIVAWSPDGTQVAAHSADGLVHLWDAASGKELRNLKVEEADNIRWSPDGTQLVWSSQDDNTIRLWDVASSKELHILALPLTAP